MAAFAPRPVIALAGLALAAAAVFAPAALATKPKVAAAPGAATIADMEKAAGKKIVRGQTVTLKTTKGTIEFVLFPKAAPKTVENFVKLAKKGFYDGTTFHRVIPGFVSQGGDPKSKTLPAFHGEIGTGGPGYTIPDEHDNGLKHMAGAVAMAHSSMPNSAGSQFYISHRAIPHLDGGYTIFGLVTKGFEVALALAPSERDSAAVQAPKPDKIVKATVK